MKIIVYPVWQLVEKDMMQGVAAVVIDVLRATSSITAGIENGASSIIPVENIETASRIVDPGDRSTKLLAGEWKGHKVEGFDLDNSPLQFSRQNVEKKTVIFTTSNGTHAILAASRAKRVLIASLSNVEAVAAALAEEGDIGIVCAGNGGWPASEDLLCAGVLIDILGSSGSRLEMGDTARISMMLAERTGSETEEFLKSTDSGKRLLSTGYKDDIIYCSKRGTSDVLPELKEGRIIASAR